MLTTTVYLPEELNQRVTRLATKTGKAKAKIIREALTEGLRQIEGTKSNAGVLAQIAKLHGEGPVDFAQHHDAYGWE